MHAPYTPPSVRPLLYQHIESNYCRQNGRENSNLVDYFENQMQQFRKTFQTATLRMKDAFIRSEAGICCKETRAKEVQKVADAPPASRIFINSDGLTFTSPLHLPTDILPGFRPVSFTLDLLWLNGKMGIEFCSYDIVDWNRKALSYCEDDSTTTPYAVGWITGLHKDVWLQYVANIDLACLAVYVINDLAGIEATIPKAKESRLGEVCWRNRGEVPKGKLLPSIKNWEGRSQFFETNNSRFPDAGMKIVGNCIHHYMFDKADTQRIVERSKELKMYEFGKGTKEEPFRKISKEIVELGETDVEEDDNDGNSPALIGVPEMDLSLPQIAQEVEAEDLEFFNTREVVELEALESTANRFIKTVEDANIQQSLTDPANYETVVSFFKVLSTPVGIHADHVSRLLATSIVETQFEIFNVFARHAQYLMAKVADFLNQEIKLKDQLIADSEMEVARLERLRQNITDAATTRQERENRLEALNGRKTILQKEEKARRFGPLTKSRVPIVIDNDVPFQPTPPPQASLFQTPSTHVSRHHASSQLGSFTPIKKHRCMAPQTPTPGPGGYQQFGYGSGQYVEERMFGGPLVDGRRGREESYRVPFDDGYHKRDWDTNSRHSRCRRHRSPSRDRRRHRKSKYRDSSSDESSSSGYSDSYESDVSRTRSRSRHRSKTKHSKGRSSRAAKERSRSRGGRDRATKERSRAVDVEGKDEGQRGVKRGSAIEKNEQQPKRPKTGRAYSSDIEVADDAVSEFGDSGINGDDLVRMTEDLEGASSAVIVAEADPVSTAILAPTINIEKALDSTIMPPPPKPASATRDVVIDPNDAPVLNESGDGTNQKEGA